MAKKKPTITTTGSSTNVPLSGIYGSATGSSSISTITLANSTTGTYITNPGGIYSYPYVPNPIHYTPPVTDGFYEDEGRLFWKNSKGEVFQVTFTKQETVKQILEDL